MKSKEWLEDEAGAALPDRDSLQADACAPTYRYDSHTRLVLESKAAMRRRDASSPDKWDAVAMTRLPMEAASFEQKADRESDPSASVRAVNV